MRLVFLLASVTAVMAAGTDNNGYANSFSYGNGQGFGYSGSFAGPGGPGGGGSPPPNFPPFDFNSLYNQYFEFFQKFNQQLAAALQNQQNAISSGAQGFTGGYPPQGGGGFGGGFSSFGGQGAAASASVGSEGTHQTAAVFPENPKIPNVNNRFASSPPGGSSYGIFTSSQSFSSDVDGKQKNYHQATTTINDNGKVTSYTVHNP